MSSSLGPLSERRGSSRSAGRVGVGRPGSSHVAESQVKAGSGDEPGSVYVAVRLRACVMKGPGLERQWQVLDGGRKY